ncbi:MAG: hypothetical protein SO188_04010 [Prevotella sp.]|nr:hypothetical protein [Prevotella sp.]
MTVEKYLRNLFWGTVAVPLLIATVYECDVLPTGVFAGKAQEEFLAVIIMELMTIVMIPLALRLFKAKDVERKVAEGDTLALRRWGALRILMITVPLLLNTIGYYLFMNTTFGYMALILLICLPFVYTSPKK